MSKSTAIAKIIGLLNELLPQIGPYEAAQVAEKIYEVVNVAVEDERNLWIALAAMRPPLTGLDS